jgi:hypothetical protein
MEDSRFDFDLQRAWAVSIARDCVCHSHQRPTECRNPTLYSSGQSDAPAGAKEEKALSTQMSPRVARDLAICLWLAADEADSAAKVRLPSQKP